MKNIAIIGVGAYGLAIANHLAKKEVNIKIWCESAEKLESIKESGEFSGLPGVKLSEKFIWSTDMQSVLEDVEIVFIAVAAQYVDSVSEIMKPYYKNNMHVCICSKGIEIDTCRFVNEVFEKYIKTDKLAIISGPSFAIDIANGDPVGLAVASCNDETIKIIKEVMQDEKLKLRETDDIIGIEICGSVKNIIAIASGIVGGLGYSDSTRAFLINEAMHDIKNLICDLGGNNKTILSFAGIGDLLLTCTSDKSRNYSYGKLIGEKKYDEAKKYLEETTVEGYWTLKSIYKLIKNKKIDMPIIDLINQIILNNDDPNILIEFLINKK